jgi:hypothetical protein
VLQTHRKTVKLWRSQKSLRRYWRITKSYCIQIANGGNKKLGSTLELLQWKASNGVTDKGFEELLGIVKNMLPEGNELLSIIYEAKKVICPFGLEAQKIRIS